MVELALQRQLEVVVRERAFLHETAAAAYQAYLRGYAAHSKVVKRYVHLAQLHLGHLARSFGLKEPPSTVVRLQQKKSALARAPARGKAGGDAYLAAGHEYVAGGAPRKLSLAERMRKQPAARMATPVGTSLSGGARAPSKMSRAASVSEFGAGID